MVKIVYMYSRRAKNYDLSYDQAFEKHCLGDEYVVPADARMDGIGDV